MFDSGGFFADVKGLIIGLINIYSYVVLIRVLISWFNPNPDNPLVQFLRGVTDPALDTVRSFLPRFFWATGIDFTPIVLFFLLKLVVIFLHRIFPAAGMSMAPQTPFAPIPSQVDFPAQEARDPRVLARRQPVSQIRRCPSRRADLSVLRRAALLRPACPTTDTCWRLSPKTWCPATGRCAAFGSNAAGAGTATACPSKTKPSSSSGCGSRRDILEYGVTPFNEACRDLVLRYTAEWQKLIERLGRWVDWDDQYRTMDPDFMESVWWVFKSLWDKGLVYEGYKSLAYCPRCSTPLSNFEVNQGYQDTQDPSITVRFPRRRRAASVPTCLDDDPVDLALQHGLGRRPRHQLRARHHRRRGAVNPRRFPSSKASSVGTTARSPR